MDANGERRPEENQNLQEQMQRMREEMQEQLRGTETTQRPMQQQFMEFQRDSGSQKQTSQQDPEAEEHGGVRKGILTLKASEPPTLDDFACYDTNKKKVALWKMT